MPDRDVTGEAVTGKLLPGAVLAGYRLVRRVGSDAGRERWLAYSEARALTVVVTVCRDDEAVRRWMPAQAQVQSPHVLGLLDIASIADSRVLLVAEQTDWTVATLLSSRSRLSAGEAVTILAPVTAGLAAIHAAGFAHGGLGASTVFFAADGRPVIGGLHRGDSARVDRSTDFRALSALVRAVASVVEEGARDGFMGLADWLESTIEDPGATNSLASQLECRIFSLASPLPVVLIADRRPSMVHAGSHALRRHPVALPGIGVMSAALSALSALPGIPGAIAMLGSVGIGGWFRRLVRGRGPQIALAVAVTAAIGGTGLMTIPAGRDAHESTLSAPAAVQDPTARDPALHAPAVRPSAPGPRDRPVFTTEEAAATAGEDPIAAVEAILALRTRCAAAQDVSCPEQYADVGSPTEEADRYALESTSGETMLLLDVHERARVDLVQAEGEVVLLRVIPANEKRQPVLALVVRTDTGWRLRDLFPEN